METITKSASETKELGQKLAADIVGAGRATIALIGELGSGKTTFAQGFAKGLGIKRRILSPTFILMRKYGIPDSGSSFFHVDLYRLEENVEDEVINLGITDFWGKAGNIILIEWAEKIEKILPEGVIKIKFEVLSEFERKVALEK